MKHTFGQAKTWLDAVAATGLTGLVINLVYYAGLCYGALTILAGLRKEAS